MQDIYINGRWLDRKKVLPTLTLKPCFEPIPTFGMTPPDIIVFRRGTPTREVEETMKKLDGLIQE